MQHHLNHSTEHIFFEDADGTRYSGKDTHQAVYRAAAFIQDQLNHENDQTVGLYLENEPLTYSSMMKGVVVSGNRVLALSNRNSVPALANLIKKTEAHYLVYGSTSLQLTNNAREVKYELAKDGYNLNLVEAPSIDKLFPESGDFSVKLDPMPPNYEDDAAVAVILHSSGSSGSFPKPISISNQSIRGWALSQNPTADSNVMNMHQKKVYAGALPTFHAMGFFVHVVGSLTTPYINTIPKVSLPPPFPTPEGVLKGVSQTHSDIVVVVPAFIEEWAKDSESVALLKNLDLVLYGGAGLGDTGNVLAKEGVPLLSAYGSTECGPACSCFEVRDSSNVEDWAYVVLSSNYSHRMIHQGDSLYELQYLQSDRHVPSVSNLVDVIGYNTGDLGRFGAHRECLDTNTLQSRDIPPKTT